MQVERPTLTIWERAYLPRIFAGMWLTVRHIFRKKFTRPYPEQKPPLYGDYRGVPTLVRDPEGRVKCVACQLCEFVCPPKAIRVIPGERPADRFDANVEKQPQDFIIDMLRCIYCGFCEEVCPEEAIFLKNDFAVAGYSREELRFHKEKLLELGGVHEQKIWKWKFKDAPLPATSTGPAGTGKGGGTAAEA